ncbi:MAG TPA: outer membrane protein assembly factor BamA [Candidatus Acidoferrales bacterium]|nr:outer membrane protein assembly factor BamA [Candidatus Acidoferrales bacterium]
MARTANRGLETLLILLLWLSFALAPADAAAPPATIADVRIKGNLRVEEDGIRIHLKARPGAAVDPSLLEQDVKAIYRMGFFDDVKAELSDDGVLTYVVKEKPYIKDITIEGTSKIGKDKVETAFGLRPRTILDKDKVAEGVERVRKLYSESGYANAQVEYAISPAENNQASVALFVSEGEQFLIEKISFEGNRAFSSSELRRLMGTKEKWFLSFLTNRGVLDHDVLTNDMAILSAHYYDHGYVRHRIDDPVVLRGKEGIEIVIRIHEGEQYRVGKVEIGGDMIEEPEKLLRSIQLTSGQILRGNRLREDITGLTEKYSNKGFAFAKVDPVTKIDDQAKTVDVAFVITRGPPVYFNRVMFAGNTKTRDWVIRRELEVAEQERFSSDRIKRSREALQRTGYFEDVQLSTRKTERSDAVDLVVDVKEGTTGTFSIGAGYSSGDSFIFNAAVQERNLFGKGQSLAGYVDFGFTRRDFIVNFTEPYFRGRPVAVGIDAFNTLREYNEFTSKRLGFAVRTSYLLKHATIPFIKPGRRSVGYEGEEVAYDDPPTFLDYTRAGISYGLTRETIGDIEDTAALTIKDQEGTTLTSAVTPSLSYDSRDHFFAPTKGAISSLSLKIAGLGGDSRFLKADLGGRWYYPLLKDPNWGGTYTLAVGGALGYGIGYGGTTNLPLFERYFPGGINSVRGFQDRSLGPREGDDSIGGDKQAILNFEILFPILERIGLRGVAFFDMGQAFRESESINFGAFRRSVGVGARWMSPFGPLRVELGFPLNAKSGDDTSIVGFSLGQ